ncbi:MAG: ATP-grasp domain-containing protein [Lachnospiraceae bacterium]|nr:ATP-grasp domain-containing protein [Lachnospiraceae bacterium]
MENIIIVDPFSTGVNFLEDIEKRGFHPIGLWSRRSKEIFDLMEEVRRPIEHEYNGRADFFPEEKEYKDTLKKVRELKPGFVIPGADLGIELAARLSEDLALPGNPVERIPVLTNKFLMHRALTERGIRGIRGKIVHNLDETIGFYREQGFKGCVLKPYRGASSVDVRICDSEEELKAAYDEVFAVGNYMGGEEEGMLLQERISGTEYIVNSVSLRGRHKLSAIWKHSKKKVEGGGMVYNYTESLSRPEAGCTALVKYAFDVLNALGVENGNVHSEFMIDKDGPVLIEINCRPMGSDMPAEFLDRIWGHHETDLCLDAYLNPDAFFAHINDPFRPLAKGLKKHIITDKEMDVIQAPVLSIITRQKSYCNARLGKAVADHLARTVDLDTSAGVIYLANEDEGQLYRDRDFLERTESKYYDMLFTGRKTNPEDRPKDLKSVKEVLEDIKPVGSVLVLSNDITFLPGVTVSSPDNLSKASGGFRYAVLDLSYRENEDYEGISEMFFTLCEKVRKGGYVIVPESTYWHLSCGMESIEILCEAAGLFIEVPKADTGNVVIACKD